jgi:hypothetical protein
MLQVPKIIRSWSMKFILHWLLHIVRTRASRYTVRIKGSSNISIIVICIYIRRLRIHNTIVDCNLLMTLSS